MAAVSLRENSDLPPLTLHQKAKLAVVFASSVLQLSKDSWGVKPPDEDPWSHEGPWLQRNWKDTGICFLENYLGKLSLGDPYLPIPIEDPARKSAQTSAQKIDLPYQSATLVALALTLLHLQSHEDRVLEEFDTICKNIRAEGYRNPDTTDYVALLHLLQDSQAFLNQVDDQYKTAIQACLRGRLVDAIGEEDERTVQQYFFQDIIIPLNSYLKTLESSENLSIQKKYSEQKWSLWDDHDGEEHQGDSTLSGYADTWFEKFESKVQGLVDLSTSRHHKDPIKVAIIDTGLDFPREARSLYKKQIKDCRTWLYCDTSKHIKMEDLCTDSDGHGTHCASTVLKVAQNAHIYVAKVLEIRSQEKARSETTTQAIVKALNYAIDEWKVDIINMSFGCRNRVAEIDEVMERAERNRIIMVAAACNLGALEPISWPAKSNRVICVHAADGFGNPAPFTPDPEPNNHNFAAPGMAILGYCPKGSDKLQRRMTGTSCAAPVVAGIVAVLLEFVRKHEAEYTDKHRLLELLRERRGITAVLQKMVSKGGRNKYDFLSPWSLLDVERPYQHHMNTILETLGAVG
ncbi:unnamed protein product [Fusarium graminearum]|nr:unnamed protein product [Fusarium graminearum]